MSLTIPDWLVSQLQTQTSQPSPMTQAMSPVNNAGRGLGAFNTATAGGQAAQQPLQPPVQGTPAVASAPPQIPSLNQMIGMNKSKQQQGLIPRMLTTFGVNPSNIGSGIGSAMQGIGNSIGSGLQDIGNGVGGALSGLFGGL